MCKKKNDVKGSSATQASEVCHSAGLRSDQFLVGSQVERVMHARRWRDEASQEHKKQRKKEHNIEGKIKKNKKSKIQKEERRNRKAQKKRIEEYTSRKGETEE